MQGQQNKCAHGNNTSGRRSKHIQHSENGESNDEYSSKLFVVLFKIDVKLSNSSSNRDALISSYYTTKYFIITTW